jgi:hypothetical protein
MTHVVPCDGKDPAMSVRAMPYRLLYSGRGSSKAVWVYILEVLIALVRTTVGCSETPSPATSWRY